MERLTIRVDNGLEEIYFYNPDDPEGAYTLSDIAKNGHDDICDQIANRLAAYEDTGLTPERIRELQNAFNILFESERQKQQENEQLRAQVAQYREALIIANHRMPDVGQFCACVKCARVRSHMNCLLSLMANMNTMLDMI